MWRAGAIRRPRAELKYDKSKGFVEELYHEEHNRDFATMGGGRHNTTHEATKGGHMEVSNLKHAPAFTHGHMYGVGCMHDE